MMIINFKKFECCIFSYNSKRKKDRKDWEMITKREKWIGREAEGRKEKEKERGEQNINSTRNVI